MGFPARLTVSTAVIILATSLTLSGIACAQTASPSVLPPLLGPQPTVDRAGIDRTSGTISNPYFEAVAIGNKFSSLSVSYDASGANNHASYLEIERVRMYGGGFIVARVASRGSVHLFVLGGITESWTGVYPAGHIGWTYSPYGPSMSDTYADYNNDGAILACSGGSAQMYSAGTCSLYLGADGSRTDFRMPSVPYYLNILNKWPTNSDYEVLYAFPKKVVMPDGEEVSYIYNNYGDYDWEAGSSPGPTSWNAIESSLGYRIYLSAGTPTGGSPGTTSPIAAPTNTGALYAINTSIEYADPATLSRSFSAASFSSVRNAAAGGGLTLVNNGIPIATVNLSSGTTIIKPNGGSIHFTGLGTTPIQTFHGQVLASGATPFSTPQSAFPALSFQVTRNTTTSYSVTYNNTAYVPELYQGTVTNPDGSTESFVVQYGTLQSQTDGLGRTTTYGYAGQDGNFYGIVGYARLTRLLSISRPDGSGVTYGYSHGAISGSSVTATSGGSSLTTSVGLPSSCTVANYRVCNKPTYVIDPKGNQTDFTYDPVHGGILTETSPADATGVRAQKRYSYTQLYPKTLNSSGVLVSGPPVWRLTRSSECTSATPSNPSSCVGTASEHLVEFTYASNNLFLTSEKETLGDGSQSRITTYTYDYAGNVLSKDGPRTDVDDMQYTTYDALRRKLFEISPDPDGTGPLPRIVLHHVYDADGNEIRTEHGTGNNLDGSDFAVHHFERFTYDSVTGAVLKKEVVTP